MTDHHFDHNETALLLASINVGIARMNADSRLIYANPAFCKITGYAAEELELQHYSLFIKEHDNVELDYWDALLRRGKRKNYCAKLMDRFYICAGDPFYICFTALSFVAVLKMAAVNNS